MLDVITLANTLPSRVKQATSVAAVPIVSSIAITVSTRGARLSTPSTVSPTPPGGGPIKAGEHAGAGPARMGFAWPGPLATGTPMTHLTALAVPSLPDPFADCRCPGPPGRT